MGIGISTLKFGVSRLFCYSLKVGVLVIILLGIAFPINRERYEYQAWCCYFVSFWRNVVS
jgi:hypothetical protein